ncbi:MAG TPA: HD domain-containing phosphohydrolase [Holophagaceae bacterium]|nr:HD domain-containing phosphohydrolase [Holophagaceae bacterium]
MSEPNDELLFAEDAQTVPAPGSTPWKLLIVDDEEQVHAVTRLVLSDFEFEGRGLEFVSAYSGMEGAQRLLQNPDTAVILLDVVMEFDHAGLHLARQIREEFHNHDVRIVLRTGQPGQAPEKRAFLDYDINDYRTKTELTSDRLFTAMVGALRNYQDINRIKALYESVKSAQLGTVVAMADLAEFKDEDTGEHVLRIRARSEAVARELAQEGPYVDLITDIFLELIGAASVLHDVGKVAIPDGILRKPGKLDEEEWKVMRTHAALGENLLFKVAQMTPGHNVLTVGSNIAGGHHEKWDGSGYPKGLKGEEIPLEARIVAVADVYDALTSKRCYKAAWSPDEALAELRRSAGTHLDPAIVDAMERVVARERAEILG